VHSDLFQQFEAFPIEKGIEIGRDNSGRMKARWLKPDLHPRFDRMEVGDSFAVRPADLGGAPLIVVQNYVSGSAATFCKGFVSGARKFTTRQRGDHVRVWRIV
jgi:hypothetical protein